MRHSFDDELEDPKAVRHHGSVVACLVCLLLLAFAFAGCSGGAQAAGAWVGTVDTVGDTEVVTTSVSPQSEWPPIDTASAIVNIWPGDSLERPSAMAIDSRRRLLIADRTQIVVLAPSGEFSTAMGRRGSGPGEFHSIRGLGVLAADTVIVLDGTEQRVTWLTDSGRVVRTRSITGPASFTDARRVAMAPLEKGLILAWGFSLVRPGGPSDSVALVYHDWSSLAPQRLAVIEDVSWVNGGQMLGSRYPFGPRALYAVSRSGLFAYTSGVDYCIRVGRVGDVSVRRICREWTRQPVGGASRLPDDTAGTGSAGPGLAGVLARQEFGPKKNSIDEIQFDEQDHLWVRVVDASHQHHPMYMSRLPRLRPRYYVWEVFSGTGRLAARVAIPSRFRPLLFLSASLFGVVEDDGGALSVARVDLPRSVNVTIR